MEQQWNDTDRKTEGLGENLSQCHSVHHKSHMACPNKNPGLCIETPMTNCLRYGMVPQTNHILEPLDMHTCPDED
jgi:hypothetical protein